MHFAPCNLDESNGLLLLVDFLCYVSYVKGLRLGSGEEGGWDLRVGMRAGPHVEVSDAIERNEVAWKDAMDV